ncbi:MAG: efflux RND transporter periplasmic adaptor subunit [bacterium]
MSIFKKSLLIFALVVAVISFLALGLPRLIAGSGEIPEVGVAEVIRGRIEETVDAPGRISSSEIRHFQAEASGIMRLVKINEGQKVESGDVLCVIVNPVFLDLPQELHVEKLLFDGKIEELIDCFRQSYSREIEDLESARVNYLLSQKRHDQHKLLYDEGAISHQQLDDMEMEYKRAEFSYQASRREFENKMAKFRVIASFSGMVIKSQIQEGKSIKEGEELCTIVDIGQLITKVVVDEFEANKVKKGQAVRVIGNMFAPHILQGWVESIGASCLDSYQAGFAGVEVICKINNNKVEGPDLKIGSLITAKITTSQKKDALIIPANSVLIKDNGKAVFVVYDNKAELRDIEAGISNEEFVEVIRGLKPGEKVVTRGNLDIKPGQRVKIR